MRPLQAGPRGLFFLLTLLWVLAVLSLHPCAEAFSSSSKQGLLLAQSLAT